MTDLPLRPTAGGMRAPIPDLSPHPAKPVQDGEQGRRPDFARLVDKDTTADMASQAAKAPVKDHSVPSLRGLVPMPFAEKGPQSPVENVPKPSPEPGLEPAADRRPAADGAPVLLLPLNAFVPVTVETEVRAGASDQMSVAVARPMAQPLGGTMRTPDPMPLQSLAIATGIDEPNPPTERNMVPAATVRALDAELMPAKTGPALLSTPPATPHVAPAPATAFATAIATGTTTTAPIVAQPAVPQAVADQAAAVPRLLRVTLKPAELGPVQIVIQTGSDATSVRILAETEAGYHALLNKGDVLAALVRDLRAASVLPQPDVSHPPVAQPADDRANGGPFMRGQADDRGRPARETARHAGEQPVGAEPSHGAGPDQRQQPAYKTI